MPTSTTLEKKSVAEATKLQNEVALWRKKVADYRAIFAKMRGNSTIASGADEECRIFSYHLEEFIKKMDKIKRYEFI